MTQEELAQAYEASRAGRANRAPTQGAAGIDERNAYGDMKNAAQAEEDTYLADTVRLRELDRQIDDLEREIAQKSKWSDFEQQHGDNPYWQMAKRSYIVSGDTAPIQSFMSREDAYQQRLKAEQLSKEQKEEQKSYDEADARKQLTQAQIMFDEAERLYNETKDKSYIAKMKQARNDIEYWAKKANVEIEPADITDSNEEPEQSSVSMTLSKYDTYAKDTKFDTEAEKNAAITELEALTELSSDEVKKRDKLIADLKANKSKEAVAADKAAKDAAAKKIDAEADAWIATNQSDVKNIQQADKRDIDAELAIVPKRIRAAVKAKLMKR